MHSLLRIQKSQGKLCRNVANNQWWLEYNLSMEFYSASDLRSGIHWDTTRGRRESGPRWRLETLLLVWQERRMGIDLLTDQGPGVPAASVCPATPGLSSHWTEEREGESVRERRETLNPKTTSSSYNPCTFHSKGECLHLPCHRSAVEIDTILLIPIQSSKLFTSA